MRWVGSARHLQLLELSVNLLLFRSPPGAWLDAKDWIPSSSSPPTDAWSPSHSLCWKMSPTCSPHREIPATRKGGGCWSCTQNSLGHPLPGTHTEQRETQQSTDSLGRGRGKGANKHTLNAIIGLWSWRHSRNRSRIQAANTKAWSQEGPLDLTKWK